MWKSLFKHYLWFYYDITSFIVWYRFYCPFFKLLFYGSCDISSYTNWITRFKFKENRYLIDSWDKTSNGYNVEFPKDSCLNEGLVQVSRSQYQRLSVDSIINLINVYLWQCFSTAVLQHTSIIVSAYILGLRHLGFKYKRNIPHYLKRL